MRWLAWVVLAVAIAGGALVEGATASPGYVSTASVWFWVAVAVSVLALLAETITLPWAAGAIVRRTGLGRLPWSLVGWGAILTFVTLLVAVLAPLALFVLWPLEVILLAGAATGRWQAFWAFRAFARHPWRASLATFLALLAGLLGVVVALTSGLLLTGFLGGLVAWLWVGTVGTALLLWWTRLVERP
jgi:hypothetical protein